MDNKEFQYVGFLPSSQTKWESPSIFHLLLRYIVIFASFWFGLYAFSGCYSKNHYDRWITIEKVEKPTLKERYDAIKQGNPIIVPEDKTIYDYSSKNFNIGAILKKLFGRIKSIRSYNEKEAYIDYINRCDDRISTGIPLFLILLVLSAFLPLKKFPPKIKISEYCDFIQPFKRSDKYVLYIWKNKWGVMDVENYKPAIDPIYDHLEWLVKNEKLKCTINGQESYITVKNRKVYYEALSDKTKNNKPLYLFLSICVVTVIVYALYNLFEEDPYVSDAGTNDQNQNSSNVSFTGSANFRKTTYRCGICGCEGYWGYEHGNGAYEGSCSNTRPGGHSCGHSPQQHNLKQW